MHTRIHIILTKHWESYIVRCEWHDVLKDSFKTVHVHVCLLGEGVRSSGDGFTGGYETLHLGAYINLRASG